jgi:hypothetical protein
VRGVLHPPGTGTVVLAACGVVEGAAGVALLTAPVPLGRVHAALESAIVRAMAVWDGRRWVRMR